MFRSTLMFLTFCALVLVAHGSRLAFAQSPQQAQQRELQERAERQRQAEQRKAGERVEQQRRAEGLAEQQRDIEERIARRQRDEQRESEESMARQRRARSHAEEQREAQEQQALLLERQADAERQRQIQQQEQGQGRAPDTQVELQEPVAQPEPSTRPERVFSPALLAFVGSCLLAAISLFMLGRIVHQRFTHR
jgi:hypothetical protein